MKNCKVDIDILLEGLRNIGHDVKGRKHTFIASWIGTVELVDATRNVCGNYDYDIDTWECAAVQLPNGPIVGVCQDGTFVPLNRGAHYGFNIHWGEYPRWVPLEIRTIRCCPIGLLPRSENLIHGITAANYEEDDELPF